MTNKAAILLSTLLLTTTLVGAQGSEFDIPTIDVYNLHGNVKEVYSVVYSIAKGDIIERDTLYMLFNREGQLVECHLTNSGEMPFYTYHYDNGKITEWLNHDNSDCSRYTYRYGADSCLAEVIHTYSEEGMTIFADTFYIICDEQCRIISEGGSIDRTYYTYNDDGLVATMSYDNNFIIYEYDSQKRLKEEIWKEGSSQSITSYIRDAYGNITDEIWTKPEMGSSSRRHISFILDHHGNWTTLEDGDGTAHRTIKYFDE